MQFACLSLYNLSKYYLKDLEALFNVAYFETACMDPERFVRGVQL